MTKNQKKTSTVNKNCDKIFVRRIRRKGKNRKRSLTDTKRDNKQLEQSIDRRDDAASSLKIPSNQCKQLPPTEENPSVGGLLPPFLKHCRPKGTESKSYDIWLNTMSIALVYLLG